MENYFDCFEEQKTLTEELVGIRSVVGSDGCEQAVAEHIRDLMGNWDYFKDNPGDLFLVPTENDTLKRSSVVAVIEPEAAGVSPNGTMDAVMLMGHIDTVETSDYGVLEPLATKPGELQKALREISDGSVVADIDSGRYMFGRGALDMKAGVASCLYILKHFSENRSALSGALIALFECDEEGDSHGAITSMKFIRQLSEERCIRIKAAVCADYSSNEPAAYLGTIGKYLPCAMAFGRSSHVGQVFSSMDPNLMISDIVSAIDYNTDLCEENLGETTQPPVSLKQSDTKTTYSVQTADSAYAYFNWFSLRKTGDEILSLFKKEVEKTVRKTAERITRAKKDFYGRRNVIDAETGELYPRVMTLDEYAENVGSNLGEADPHTDIRKFWISEAERLHGMDRDMTPVVLVFMAGVSYPPVTVDPDSELGAVSSRLGIPVRTYYPFISDASFISLLGDVPLVNLGTYGKDAHMFTERVDMEYSFKKLPNLTWELLLSLLGQMKKT